MSLSRESSVGSLPPLLRQGSSSSDITSSENSTPTTPRSRQSFSGEQLNNAKRGFLKRKGFWSAWRDYYFVLEKDSEFLLEFHNENSNQPTRALSLKGCILRMGDVYTGLKNSFVLFAEGKDPIFLLADSNSSFLEWVVALTSKCKLNEQWKEEETLEKLFFAPTVQSDDKGIITACNSAFLKLFGYTRQQIISSPVTRLMPPPYDKLHEKFMSAYAKSGTKRLLAKPRNLPVLFADGTKKNLMLCLTECTANRERRYLATFKQLDLPNDDEDNSETEDSSEESAERTDEEGERSREREREKEKEKDKEKETEQHGDTESLVNTLTVEQRNSLLLKYAERSASNQAQLDELLKSFTKQDPTTLVRFKSKLQENDQKQRTTLRIGKLKIRTSRIQDFSSSDKIALQDYKKFWFENSVRKNAVTIDDPQEQLRVSKIASYVPKLVMRRLYNRENGIELPEIETFPACVAFADISGYTKTSEQLASKGPIGLEILSKELNTYFDKLITIIHRYGGDVIKFAGDALLVVWATYSRTGLGGMTVLASQCFKEMISQCGTYTVESVKGTLNLHVGIGSGEITGIHVGGCHERVEFFVSGSVLEQVSECEKAAVAGEVFVSDVAWHSVEKGRLVGTKRGNNWLLEKVVKPMDFPQQQQFPLYADMETQLTKYVQDIALENIDSSQWLGELRDVSVIFVKLLTDIKEQNVLQLQQIFRSIQEVVYHHEGVIRQFMVDDKGSVCIIGLGVPPFAHPDDPERSIETALEIREKLLKRSVDSRIGITTGPCFVGDVGGRSRREYAMVGDFVNLSARLMISTSNPSILVDSSTLKACKENDKFQFLELEPIKIKGKEKKEKVFVPSFKSNNVPHHHQHNHSHQHKPEPQLVGRESELTSILHAVSLFKQEKETRMIVLEGAGGIGKSEMMSLIERRLEHSMTFRLVANQIDVNNPYRPWKALFSKLLPSLATSYLVEKLEVESDMLALLNSVIETGVRESDKTLALNPQFRAETIHNLLLKILQLTLPIGSLLLVKNAQWFDISSWSLVFSALQNVPGVLIVVSLTPMKTPPLDYIKLSSDPHVLKIVLGAFGKNEVGELIKKELKLEVEAPSELVSLIHQKSQGNPFFAKQVVKSLMESGGIHVSNGQVSITTKLSRKHDVIPSSVNGLINSKVDNLEGGVKIVLKVASVCGNVFTLQTLMQLLPSKSESELLNDMSYLVGEGLVIVSSSQSPVTPTHRRILSESINIRRSSVVPPSPKLVRPGTESPTSPKLTKSHGHFSEEKKEEKKPREWSFANTLIRDVVYNSMLYSQKKDYHRILARILEEKHPGENAYYALMAYHLKNSDQFSEALDYFLRSGTNALNKGSYGESVQLLQEAQELSVKINDKSVLSIDIKRHLAQALMQLGRLSETETVLRATLSLMGIEIPVPSSSILKQALKSLQRHSSSSDSEVASSTTTISSSSNSLNNSNLTTKQKRRSFGSAGSTPKEEHNHGGVLNNSGGNGTNNNNNNNNNNNTDNEVHRKESDLRLPERFLTKLNLRSSNEKISNSTTSISSSLTDSSLRNSYNLLNEEQNQLSNSNNNNNNNNNSNNNNSNNNSLRLISSASVASIPNINVLKLDHHASSASLLPVYPKPNKISKITFFVGTEIKKSELMERKSNAVNCLTMMARISYWTGRSGLGEYCATLATSIAEELGSPYVLGEALSYCGLLESMNGRTEDAISKFKRCRTLEYGKRMLATETILDFNEALFLGGIGHFEQSEQLLHLCSEHATTTGDLRMFEECCLQLASINLVRGAFEESRELASRAIKSAHVRDDFVIQLRGTLSLLRVDARTVDLESTKKLLGNIQRWQEIGYNFGVLEVHLLKAVYCAHSNQASDCSKLILKCLDNVIQLEPSTLTSHFPHEAAAQCLIWLWSVSNDLNEKKELRSKLKRLLLSLRRFGERVSVAIPAYHLYDAMYHFLESQKVTSHVLQHFQSALSSSKQLGMMWDYHLVSFVRAKLTNKKEELQRVFRVFPKLNFLGLDNFKFTKITIDYGES